MCRVSNWSESHCSAWVFCGLRTVCSRQFVRCCRLPNNVEKAKWSLNVVSPRCHPPGSYSALYMYNYTRRRNFMMTGLSISVQKLQLVLLSPVHTGDYTRRKRRQSPNSATRRKRRLSPRRSETIVACVDRALGPACNSLLVSQWH